MTKNTWLAVVGSGNALILLELSKQSAKKQMYQAFSKYFTFLHSIFKDWDNFSLSPEALEPTGAFLI